MANLYADANFYITEINFQTVHGNNVYDVAWAHTGNNTTANFTVLADNVISNVYGTGKALDFVEYEPLTAISFWKCLSQLPIYHQLPLQYWQRNDNTSGS